MKKLPGSEMQLQSLKFLKTKNNKLNNKYKVSALFIVLLITTIFSNGFSQISLLAPTLQEKQNIGKTDLFKKNIEAAGTTTALGIHIGLASVKSETGFNIGALAEINYNKFALTPQVNYWKVKTTSDFELSMLGRMKLGSPSAGINPYLDGGLGVEFYNNNNDNLTRLGIILGGGLESEPMKSGFILYGDFKFKLFIIKEEENPSGFFVNAGIKFPM